MLTIVELKHKTKPLRLNKIIVPKKRNFSFPPIAIKVPQKISILDEEFSKNNFCGLPTSPAIKTLEGENKILLSAPHAVSHFRNNILKKSENHTGGIVKYLSEKTKSHAIIKSKTDGTDPNWKNGFWYKHKILNMIEKSDINFLIDLHSLSPNRQNSIILCTNNLKNIQNNRNILSDFISILKKHGFNNIEIDTIYKANAIYNISNYISKKKGIPCLQIEINSKLIDPINTNSLEHFLLALELFITTLKN